MLMDARMLLFQPNINSLRLYFVRIAATELVTRSIKVMMQSGCEEVCLCLGPNIASLIVHYLRYVSLTCLDLV